VKRGQRVVISSSFEVLRLLGEGAFGKVYLVRKNFLNGLLPRLYALKLFHTETETDILKAEAEAMFRVRSPRCVTVHSIVESEFGRGFLMEYIDGITLEELCKAHEPNHEEQEYLAAHIHAGLQDLFSQHLLHGDLSPRNIIIERGGRVVLLDFGLASLFSKGISVGHPAYMSEGRLKGTAPSREDDLFALRLIRHDLARGLVGKSAPYWFWENRKREVVDFAPTGEPSRIPKSLQKKIDLLLHLRVQKPQTVALPPSPAVRGTFARYFRAPFLGPLFLMFMLSSTEAPSHVRAKAWLSIRTLHWAEVKFSDGTTADSTLQEMQVPAGRHALTWRTAKRTGVIKIDLPQNGHVILSDSDFN
jgi:serine/threonine protein kinase